MGFGRRLGGGPRFRDREQSLNGYGLPRGP